MSTLLSGACDGILRDFTIEAADTPCLILEAQRLRHQVYCVERAFLPGDGGLEVDPFDAHSLHALLRHIGSGQAVGSVRLVLPENGATGSSFPMQQVCSVPLDSHVRLRSTAEVSRVAISKEWMRAIPAAPTLLRLALFRAVVMLSARHSLTHWCAVMEPTLLRLLRGSGIHFVPLGGLVEYHGLRQPCSAAITHLLGRVRRDQPGVWSFITADGKFADAAPGRVEEAA